MGGAENRALKEGVKRGKEDRWVCKSPLRSAPWWRGSTLDSKLVELVGCLGRAGQEAVWAQERHRFGDEGLDLRVIQVKVGVFQRERKQNKMRTELKAERWSTAQFRRWTKEQQITKDTEKKCLGKQEERAGRRAAWGEESFRQCSVVFDSGKLSRFQKWLECCHHCLLPHLAAGPQTTYNGQRVSWTSCHIFNMLHWDLTEFFLICFNSWTIYNYF